MVGGQVSHALAADSAPRGSQDELLPYNAPMDVPCPSCSFLQPIPRHRSVASICIAAAILLASDDSVQAQFFSAPLELSSSVQVDEADNATRQQLARIESQISHSEWDESIEGLRKLSESSTSKLMAVTPRRYIPVSDYCHIQLAALPDEALALYRQRVDPQAQRWYQEGVRERSLEQLERITRALYASSWGDDALLALGELALERGDHAGARAYWQQIIARPVEQVLKDRYEAVRRAADVTGAQAALLAKWYVPDEAGGLPEYRLRSDVPLSDDASRALVRFWNAHGVRSTTLAYPDTKLDLAGVRARLVLASILEGSLDRARGELEAFEKLHRGAEGHLAGKKVSYAQALTTILKSATSWPAPGTTRDWPTFAGSNMRAGLFPTSFAVGRQAWPSLELGQPLVADSINWYTFKALRVAEDARGLLSYHPVVSGKIALIANERQIFAFDVTTGGAAWPTNPETPLGEIYKDGFVPVEPVAMRGLGVPRYTLTVHDGRVYARMGSQVTGRPVDAPDESMGTLVCLDLAAQGRLEWKIRPESQKWSFEGAPLANGGNVYIALRKSEVRPQAYVACYDAQTGQLRWRTLVCSAETPSGGQYPETTHNLLTLAHGRIYYNSNLGAVAALNASDGSTRWITVYPRARALSPQAGESPKTHFQRDLNPSIYHRGLLFTAPSDSAAIFAIEADSGRMVWQTRLAQDAIHLLGVGQGNLIASGKRLWWIDAASGKLVARWPDSTSPAGYGRGLLAGNRVYWPTRDTIYVFPQRVQPAREAQMRESPVALGQIRGVSGGNLVPAGKVLLIAGTDRLYGLTAGSREPSTEDESPTLTRRNALQMQAVLALRTRPRDNEGLPNENNSGTAHSDD